MMHTLQSALMLVSATSTSPPPLAESVTLPPAEIETSYPSSKADTVPSLPTINVPLLVMSTLPLASIVELKMLTSPPPLMPTRPLSAVIVSPET